MLRCGGLSGLVRLAANDFYTCYKRSITQWNFCESFLQADRIVSATSIEVLKQSVYFGEDISSCCRISTFSLVDFLKNQEKSEAILEKHLNFWLESLECAQDIISQFSKNKVARSYQEYIFIKNQEVTEEIACVKKIYESPKFDLFLRVSLIKKSSSRLDDIYEDITRVFRKTFW